MQRLCVRLLLIFVLAGCQDAGILCPADQGIFSAATVSAQDLSYLLDLDPDAVTNRDLYDRAVALEENYQKYH